MHAGAWAFVALDIDVLLDWDPASQRAPGRIVTLGKLLVEGNGSEPDALSRPAPPPMRPLPDRWAILRTTKAINGWCKVQDIVIMFGLKGRADPKHACYKVSKRLRAKGCSLQDEGSPGAAGRPPKRARLCDLRKYYPNLR